MNGEIGLFSELPKGPISEIIMQRITDALISGELKPGDKIPTEADFSEKLGIGRNAVREAVKVLVAFGVLEIRRSEGTFVTEKYNQNLLNPLIYGLILARDSMEDLLEFKVSLLNATLYLVERNAVDEQIKELRKYWELYRDAMYEEPGDIDKMHQASINLNNYMGEISGNPMVVQLNKILSKISAYTRLKAIEVSIERNQRHLLVDVYLKEVELIEKRDKNSIPILVDEILEVWQELLL